MEDQLLDSPVYAEQPVNYAGFWLRFVASIIDGIITNIVYYIIIFLTGGGLESTSAFAIIISIVIPWLYGAFMESSEKQATLGKMALGLTVTNLEGGRISFLNATGRYFAKILSAIILLIGFIMAGFTEKKQALHDMLASTLVLKKN